MENTDKSSVLDAMFWKLGSEVVALSKFGKERLELVEDSLAAENYFPDATQEEKDKINEYRGIVQTKLYNEMGEAEPKLFKKGASVAIKMLFEALLYDNE